MATLLETLRGRVPVAGCRRKRDHMVLLTQQALLRLTRAGFSTRDGMAVLRFTRTVTTIEEAARSGLIATVRQEKSPGDLFFLFFFNIEAGLPWA